MDLRWFKYCKTEQEKQEIKDYLAAASFLLDRMRKILEEELAISIKESSDKKKYELPSWSEYQADSLGEQRTLRKVLSLITLDKR